MADEQERRAHRLDLLAQYEEKKTRVAECCRFTHKRLDEMTYKDLVRAGLTVELGTHTVRWTRYRRSCEC